MTFQKGKYVITSESVTEGHPDKICDQISDSILDCLLAQDPNARVAVETLVTTGTVFIAGEVTTSGFVDAQKVARAALERIGYNRPEYGIDFEDCGVLTAIHGQSPDIAMGVDESDGHVQGAGDQGMMYGFACNETDELMPLPITLAHKLTQRLAQLRKDGTLDYLGPDGKSQVSVEYEDGKPLRISAVVISTQHQRDVTLEKVRSDVRELVIDPVVNQWTDGSTKFHINPTGRFVIGGPEGDTGLTGRKIIVDTYGGVGRHGGGAFSGKDPSKVDRSAAYAARWVAKNIVAAGLADRCEVQLSYAIGVAEPTSINVDCFGTEKVSTSAIVAAVRKHFDLTPNGIIRSLDLKRPVYAKTAAYGHFGRSESNFTWEQTVKAESLRRECFEGTVPQEQLEVVR